MKITHALYLASAAVGMLLSARHANAQDARTVVLRFRKAGDTVAIRNAQITVDHTIDAGVTDSAGVVRIPELEDGGHIVEAVARGYTVFCGRGSRRAAYLSVRRRQPAGSRQDLHR